MGSCSSVKFVDAQLNTCQGTASMKGVDEAPNLTNSHGLNIDSTCAQVQSKSRKSYQITEQCRQSL